jgi:hypothetical protein
MRFSLFQYLGLAELIRQYGVHYLFEFDRELVLNITVLVKYSILVLDPPAQGSGWLEITLSFDLVTSPSS